ncbi:MAG TPA: Ig-like domain-containing protein [Gemmatimonadaceae bacterium]|nr:Ig-like domain-containing protein [Gemmatimonadaceae bacterium]
MFRAIASRRTLLVVVASWAMSGCADTVGPSRRGGDSETLGAAPDSISMNAQYGYGRNRIAKVVVTVDPDTMLVGHRAVANAVALTRRGDTIKSPYIIWSSTNRLVASVSTTGIVLGQSAGSAQVFALIGSVSGSTSVAVASTMPGVNDSSTVASVAVLVPSGPLIVGATIQATAVLRNAAGDTLTGPLVNWSTSDSSVARVNATGAITGAGPGTVKIAATSQGQSGSASVTVQSAVAPVATVTVSLASSSIAVGGTTAATAVAVDSVGHQLSGRTITWSSSNTAIATVDSAGTVRGVGAGLTTIVALCEGKSGSASITVTASPSPPPVATKLAVTTQPSTTAVSGQVLAQQPIIQLQDANSAAVSQAGVVVTVAIASGGGTLSGTTTATTNASGAATFSNLALTGTVGSRTLRFTAGTLTAATSNTIALAAGAATQLLVSTIGSQTVNTPFTVTVTLADASGNATPNAGASGTITLSRQSGTGTVGGTVSGTLAVGASAVTINGVTYSTAESGVQLLATGAGAGSSANGMTGASNAFTVNSSGGGFTPTIPDIYPTDGSYGWTFNGTTDAQRSGALASSDYQTPFLTTSGWLWASGEGPNGLNAVKRTYPLGTDVGPPFFYILGSSLKKFYLRFFYKQSNPFNTNGTTSDQDFFKLARFQDAGGNQILTPGGNQGGQIIGGWDAWSQTYSAGSFNYNSVLGKWDCYEVMIDLTVSNQAHQTIWVNDNVVLDNTISGSQVASATTSIKMLQFDGTVNTMVSSNSTAWFSMVGLSSQRMGCPPGYTFPN